MIEPLPACEMQCRGDERHPGHYMRLRFDVAMRQQAGLRKAPRQIEQDAGDLGQRTAVDQKGRHRAGRIDLEVVRLAHVLAVIASVAKQSSFLQSRDMDCRIASLLVMTKNTPIPA